MSMNNSFSFSFHEKTPSWLESYHSTMSDSLATKKRLESERAKVQEKMGDTQITQENYDNSLYTTFFSDDRVQHNRIVNRAAIRHWRHNETRESDQTASYQNLKAVLSGPGTLAEPELYEIDQPTTYKPSFLVEEDTYSYGMGLDRSCLEVFLTESAKEKALHDYFLGKRQKPAQTESFSFGQPTINPSPSSRLDPSLEETVQDIRPFNQSMLNSDVKARAAMAKVFSGDKDFYYQFAEDLSSDVRLGLIENSLCPSEIVEQLSHDANPMVAKAAKQRMSKS